MEILRQPMDDLVSASMRMDSTSESFQTLGPVDFWGRAVRFDETGDEEIIRLLLPINWLCSLLERIDHAPPEADRQRVFCQQLVDRLLAGCQSPDLREILIDVAVRIAARRYQSAATTLRAATA